MVAGKETMCSQAFDLSIAGEVVPFRIFVTPGKNCKTFSEANDWCQLELVWDKSTPPATAAVVQWRFTVGVGDFRQGASSNAVHNFQDSRAAGLPDGEEDWNLGAALDPSTNRATVIFQLVPYHAV